MTRVLRSLAVILVALLSLGTYSPAQDPISSPTPDDQAQGERLFMGHCAICHGVEGTGGRGPSLNQPALRRVANDFALFQLIRQGIDGSEMPGHGSCPSGRSGWSRATCDRSGARRW